MEEEDKIQEDRTSKVKDLLKDEINKFVHNMKSPCGINKKQVESSGINECYAKECNLIDNDALE